jgi:Na+/H+ antiporter NhaD/arsenite permease-like protein
MSDRRRAGRVLRGFAWDTAAFLAGVFVLVGMLESRGVIDAVVERLAALRGAGPFAVYSIVVWASVLFSGFIDNVPYVTAMLPVVIRLAPQLGISVEILVFGLLIGSCLGGNVTPIGASANIVAMGLLKREGSPVSFVQFMKMGVPFTIAATGVSYVVLWFVYR